MFTKRNRRNCQFNTVFHQDSSASNRINAVRQTIDNNLSPLQYNSETMDGSVTFGKDNSVDPVVKITFDLDNKICNRHNINNVGNNPIMVGFDFSKLNDQDADDARSDLHRMYPNTYLDPRNDFPLYSFMPIYSHEFDIVIVQDNFRWPFQKNYF